MEVHAEILRLAGKNEDKRERIKWFHARQVFFRPGSDGEDAVERGFELARQSEHEDARFFISLFPGGPPATHLDARAVFAGEDDPRCLCWAAECVRERSVSKSWSRNSSHRLPMPGTPGQCFSLLVFYARSTSEYVAFLEKACAKGEPSAMVALARSLSSSEDSAKKVREERLWREAALLGEQPAQVAVAN